MRRAFRLVIGCFPTAATFGGGVSAVLAVAALTVLGSPHTAWGAESPRGLHVISMGKKITPDAVVLGDDGTPWFTASKYDLDDYDPSTGRGSDLLIHVTANGRRRQVPAAKERGDRRLCQYVGRRRRIMGARRGDQRTDSRDARRTLHPIP
jgi:streptogramin lyase